jgi:hypothetical protein
MKLTKDQIEVLEICIKVLDEDLQKGPRPKGSDIKERHDYETEDDYKFRSIQFYRTKKALHDYALKYYKHAMQNGNGAEG